jgi:hypothetical protein
LSRRDVKGSLRHEKIGKVTVMENAVFTQVKVG